MEPLHTEKEIQKKTGLPITSLQEYRKQTRIRHTQVGPIFRKIGRSVFYRLTDVVNWINRTEVVSDQMGI